MYGISDEKLTRRFKVVDFDGELCKIKGLPVGMF